MARIRNLLFLGLLVLLSACASSGPDFSQISRAALGLENEPYAEQILIMKSDRKLYLMSEGKAFRTYDIELGFAPVGDKSREGDGRTPEGTYIIDRRNPKSAFYLSLGISYPDAAERAEAARLGVDPGGDIFIHGRPSGKANFDSPDWTAGCISITNSEIEEMWVLVRNGTPITIRP